MFQQYCFTFVYRILSIEVKLSKNWLIGLWAHDFRILWVWVCNGQSDIQLFYISDETSLNFLRTRQVPRPFLENYVLSAASRQDSTYIILKFLVETQFQQLYMSLRLLFTNQNLLYFAFTFIGIIIWSSFKFEKCKENLCKIIT